MDFLTKQEIRGFSEDIAHGTAKLDSEKVLFEKKLLDGLGTEMEHDINNPGDVILKNKKIAKQLNKKKRLAVWKENLLRIFGNS